MKFTEFLFTTRTHGDYFLHWYYECSCGKLFGEVREKKDVKLNHPMYWTHLCGGWKVYAYHIFKPVFKFAIFFPFLLLWSQWTETEWATNFGFLVYSLILSIPMYALYEKLFRKWKS